MALVGRCFFAGENMDGVGIGAEKIEKSGFTGGKYPGG